MKNKETQTLPGKSAPAVAGNKLRGLIEKQPFFEGLSAAHFDLLAGLAIEKEFKPGTCIFREGDPANRFYIILEGKVELRYESSEHIGVPSDVLGRGDNLGWSWMFPPYYFSATAEAIAPTHTIFFYGTRLRAKCEDDHDLGYELMKRIAQVAIKHLSTARRRLQAACPPPPGKKK